MLVTMEHTDMNHYLKFLQALLLQVPSNEAKLEDIAK